MRHTYKHVRALFICLNVNIHMIQIVQSVLRMRTHVMWHAALSRRKQEHCIVYSFCLPECVPTIIICLDVSASIHLCPSLSDLVYSSLFVHILSLWTVGSPARLYTASPPPNCSQNTYKLQKHHFAQMQFYMQKKKTPRNEKGTLCLWNAEISTSYWIVCASRKHLGCCPKPKHSWLTAACLP